MEILTTNEINKTRIEWIDIAKGIGIFLMVIGHTSIPKIGSHWIYSFHMPLFFFLSGYLFNPNKYSIKELFIRKTKTMIIPYFFFVLLNWGGCELLQYHQYPPHSLLKTIINGSQGAIWFIYVLFFTEISFYLIYKLKNYIHSNYIVTIIVLLFTITSYFMYLNEIHFPYKLEVVGFSLLFYGTGYFIKNKSFFSQKINIYILFILLILSCVFAYLQEPRLDMASNTFGMGLPTIFVAYLGIYLTLQYSIVFEKKLPALLKKAIIYIGKNTIVVVGMSALVSMSMKKGFELLQIPSIINSSIRHILLWIVLSLFIYLFNKYLPFLIGK